MDNPKENLCTDQLEQKQCRRNSQDWRCPYMALAGKTLCEKHYLMLQISYQKSRERQREERELKRKREGEPEEEHDDDDDDDDDFRVSRKKMKMIEENCESSDESVVEISETKPKEGRSDALVEIRGSFVEMIAKSRRRGLNLSENKAKRGRGRPRKVREGLNESALVVTEMRTKRGWGRTKKVREGELALVVTEKKASRLKKAVVGPDEIKESSSRELALVVTDMNVKKKRGRPRKVRGGFDEVKKSYGELALVVKETEANGGRGRPRKVTYEELEERNKKRYIGMKLLMRRGRKKKKDELIAKNENSDESVIELGEKEPKKHRHRKKLTKKEVNAGGLQLALVEWNAEKMCGTQEVVKRRGRKKKHIVEGPVRLTRSMFSRILEGNAVGIDKLASLNCATKQKSSMCHQCLRSDKVGIIYCSNCKKKRYCYDCLTKWYPEKTFKEFETACPFCRGNCNCTACLHGDFGMASSCKAGGNVKLHRLLYMLHKLLPLVRQIHLEQNSELELEGKIQGTQLTEMDIARSKLDDDDRLY